MIVVLHGADELGMHRHIARLKAEIGATREEVETNVTALEGRDVKPHEILAAAMVPPFLASRRLVLVERLLDRFQPGGPGSRGSRALGPFESFLKTIESGLPPTTTLVVTGGNIETGRRPNPLLARLREIKDCEVVEYPELKGENLIRYIREEASVRGIRLRGGPSTRVYGDGEEWRRPESTDPAQLLAELHPGDTLSLANELDKLALYTRGREATVDDIALVCSGERVFTIFQFTDAVVDGNYRLARQSYDMLRESGESEQGLLALLAGPYRTMASVLDLVESGAEDSEIARIVPGGRYPNLLKRAKDRAQRHGHSGVRSAYEAIAEADRSTKTGRVKSDLAMELLIVKLSGIAPLRGGGSRRR